MPVRGQSRTAPTVGAGYEKLYRERLRLLPIVYGMEERGITLSGDRLEELREEYLDYSRDSAKVCENIARSYGYDLELPKSGNNNSLRNFVFDVMKLPPVAKSAKTGAPTLNQRVLEHYLDTLPPQGKPKAFLRRLQEKRSRDTAVQYMEGYKRFRRETGIPGWYVLYPSLNPTGTHTLRWASSNPNEQNISKKKGFNLRYCFGAIPGREWWSIDAANIELRLPAYESGETEMIQLFENPDAPPYFGSNHLLVCHILHPRLFEQCINEEGEVDGRLFKQRYKSTYYQWTKNGNFAVQYGAVESSGTADRAYRVSGGQRIIQRRFSRIAELNRRCIDFANRYGYIETIPDQEIDPERGYPIVCPRGAWGNVRPTLPLNYRIQGSAMWWMGKAMTRCDSYLSARRKEGYDGFITMQVHDELVFDLPALPPDEEGNPGNLPTVRKLAELMEKGGDDLGIPTPVSIEYHPNNWSESLSI